MGATVTTGNNTENTWGGGNEPMGASYGKLMMWFFIVSDALTFSGFLAAYGFSRFKFIETWPLADEVFTHFPFLHGVSAPMYYVALMTFILIFSSVTMVLAVDAGHHLNKAKVTFYMFLTIIGGLIFVGSQAWEWSNFIRGEYGAIETKGGSLLQFVDNTGHRVKLSDFAVSLPKEREQLTKSKGKWFMEEGTLPTYTVAEVQAGFKAHPELLIRTEVIYEDNATTKADPKNNPTLNNIRLVNLNFGENLNLIANSTTAKIIIKADALKVLEGSTQVNLNSTPTVMLTPFSANIANNYQNMFSIINIIN